MLKSTHPAGVRKALGLLLLGSALAAAPDAGAAAKPYVEERPGRGFHLFTRPKKRTPEAQWQHVQHLEQIGKIRAAANQAYALRLFWPLSPEAPAAQLRYARLLEQRGKWLNAFDAYQHLVENYPGHFEFNEVIRRQMDIARKVMDLKKGKFLFLPGFHAPERAIPLFEKIVASAPESPLAAEAFFRIGEANERIYEYSLAIDAYFNTLNRFPESEWAEKAAFAQARCHVQISDDSPNDKQALDTARAACQLYLQRHPDSPRRTEIETDLARLHDQQAANAFALARYYDRILRNPESALIEYREFIALFPDDKRVPEARRRIEQLSPSTGEPG